VETLIGLFVIVCWFIGASGPQMVNAVQNAGRGRAASPREPGLLRAGIGIGWLGVAAYLFFAPMPGGLFSRNQILIAAAVLLVWGGVSLCLGISNSHGRRDVLSAVKALCIDALPGAAGLWVPLYVSRDWGGQLTPLINYALKGFWIYLLVFGLAIIALSMRGVSGDAQKLVAKQVEEKAVVWRSARPRAR
jgi:hypothetical protein